METQPRSIKADGLAPGLSVQEVTAFSSEYSYLDSALASFLAEVFAGATCEIVRSGKHQSVPAEALRPLDALRAIRAIPARPGLQPLDGDTVDVLRRRGLREFVVTGQATPAAGEAPGTPPAAEPAGGAPAAHVGRPATPGRGKRVQEARALVDKVEAGAAAREKASDLVQDLFDQGRAGRYTTRPAQQAVEEIVSQGLAGAMVAVAGLKGSDQTYAHCVDTAVIFEETYTQILGYQGQPVNEQVMRHALLAGFCHDIGKSRVPKDILDSTARFERGSREMQLMRSHADQGARILQGLGLDAATINVAHYHHVKVDGSLPASYPQARWDDVLPITRLAAVVDVYQALIGKRSYKQNWVPGKAVEYLKSLRGTEFDPHMLDYFLRVIGLYPVGSLLRLSSGELAFVLAIGTEMLDRPVVAVLENAQGELLTHNTLIDLMHEPELSVTEVVDHYAYYAEREEQAFELFSGLAVA